MDKQDGKMNMQCNRIVKSCTLYWLKISVDLLAYYQWQVYWMHKQFGRGRQLFFVMESVDVSSTSCCYSLWSCMRIKIMISIFFFFFPYSPLATEMSEDSIRIVEAKVCVFYFIFWISIRVVPMARRTFGITLLTGRFKTGHLQVRVRETICGYMYITLYGCILSHAA